MFSRIFCSALLIIALNNSCHNKVGGLSGSKDVLLTDLDTTVSPAEDFFQYANGGWLKKNPIPNDQASWGIGNVVFEETLNRLKDINEKSAGVNAATGTADQKIGDFWRTGMDSAAVEQHGLEPLQSYFEQIKAINDIKSLVATVADLKKIGSSAMFGDFVAQDDKNSEAMAFKLWQGGLSLPERDYYFNPDTSIANIRTKYEHYIAKTLAMSGSDSGEATPLAKSIMALETRLAKSSRKLEDLRDDYRNYNKMAIADLPKLCANVDWKSFLGISGVKNIDSVIVGQPEFFKTLSDELRSTPLPVWRAYLRFNLVRDFSGALPDRFGVEVFNISRLFSGARERRPRWKRVLQNENGLMGELLGQLYVKYYVNPGEKQRYVQMTENVRDALRDHINKLTWMTDDTKQKAYAKLAAIKKKVYYPDKWKDFSAMQIGTESYIQNIINAHQWWHAYNYNKLGKPVDRDEWGMTPQTYNAEYNPSNNDITLPAAEFIVPGYKDEELDDALVYGYAAASTIGHEITHGFDDQGRKFDAKGNLSRWWTDKDSIEFARRAQLIINQFSEFEPVKGFHINGNATQGENIADLGGIVVGLDAFKKTDQYKEGKSINGFTPLQRFFLGYALSWLYEEREEILRTQVMTDVHSPSKYRVNGPFADVDEFYTAFNVTPRNRMYRPDSLRARLW